MSGVDQDWLKFEESAGRFGWMVSYADLMTILLTFMILLLSISTITQTRFDLLIEALTGEQVGNLHEVKTKIDRVVEQEALGGEVSTAIDEHGLTIQFSNALLFDSGEAELLKRAVDIFAPIGRHLVEDLEPAYGLVIEGYTDDVPISNGHYRSNWELSTSRAIHVMERLREAGLDPRRMSVQGFADTRPARQIGEPGELGTVDSAALEAARATNRRVVIRIDRLDGEVVEGLLGPKETTTTDAQTNDAKTNDAKTNDAKTNDEETR